MKIGAVDLFCGVGGLTYGLQSVGIEVIAGYDLDESCKFPYEQNNSSQFIHKNINDVTGKELKKLLKGYELKILVGCAPCQPFSKHQKKKKERENHKDWSLLYQFGRVIGELKPHIISMENVPEIVNEKVFIDFVSYLKSYKYKVTYQIVNAADYGVAQQRRRLILIASRKKNISIISPTHKGNFKTVREVIGALPSIKAGQISINDILHQASSLSELNLRRIKASKQNGTWNDWPQELLLECHKKETGKTYKSVYGRMGWDKIAPTITTQFNSYGTGRFGHPSQDRALTLREGALLQSFPDDYIFVNSNERLKLGTVARYIGNAVPPRLGEILGLSILNSLPKNRMKKDL